MMRCSPACAKQSQRSSNSCGTGRKRVRQNATRSSSAFGFIGLGLFALRLLRRLKSAAKLWRRAGTARARRNVVVAHAGGAVHQTVPYAKGWDISPSGCSKPDSRRTTSPLNQDAKTAVNRARLRFGKGLPRGVALRSPPGPRSGRWLVSLAPHISC